MLEDACEGGDDRDARALRVEVVVERDVALEAAADVRAVVVAVTREELLVHVLGLRGLQDLERRMDVVGVLERHLDDVAERRDGPVERELDRRVERVQVQVGADGGPA